MQGLFQEDSHSGDYFRGFSYAETISRGFPYAGTISRGLIPLWRDYFKRIPLVGTISEDSLMQGLFQVDSQRGDNFRGFP